MTKNDTFKELDKSDRPWFGDNFPNYIFWRRRRCIVRRDIRLGRDIITGKCNVDMELMIDVGKNRVCRRRRRDS